MDETTFRKAMGKFATGVTVVTTELDEQIHGMTANAFMSISLNPMLVTVSIDNRAKMLDKIKASGFYAVSILSEKQANISMHFAGQKQLECDMDFHRMLGIPVINEALAAIVCEVDRAIPVGDHTLFIGKVLDITMSEGQPLTFFGGKYGTNEPMKFAAT